MSNNAIPKIGGASSTLLRVLLICGIVSSLLYLGTDMLAGFAVEKGDDIDGCSSRV